MGTSMHLVESANLVVLCFNPMHSISFHFVLSCHVNKVVVDIGVEFISVVTLSRLLLRRCRCWSRGYLLFLGRCLPERHGTLLRTTVNELLQVLRFNECSDVLDEPVTVFLNNVLSEDTHRIELIDTHRDMSSNGGSLCNTNDIPI